VEAQRDEDPSAGVDVLRTSDRPARAAPPRHVLRDHVRALRPRHWTKNVLVAAVPLAAGLAPDRDLVVAVAVAFVSFCLAASSVYLVNDLRDAEEDRAHPRKRTRPVASGAVTPAAARVGAVVLAVAALAIAASTTLALVLLIAAYLALSTAYTFALKDQPVVDLVVVAAGFVLRAMAGGVAVGLQPSQWFLLTTAFGSLFVVAGKRYSEVLLVGEGRAESRRSLGGYTRGYLRFVWTMAATVTVTTYALWTFEMASQLARPGFVQASVAPMLLGVLRYALDVELGEAGEPEDTVLHDRALQAIGIVWLVLFTIGVAGG
jgi:decaprenyl-phosphate phosphoribosyltransferase